MVKYGYAKKPTGELVAAVDLVGKSTDEKFYCLSCGNELIARVNGTKMRPHFAHKKQVECSPETYLHKLSKKIGS